MYNHCCSSIVGCLGMKKWKLYKLYKAGADRLGSDFDVTRLLRTIRNNRLLIKKYLVTPEQKEALMLNPNKFINLDTSDEQDNYLDDTEQKETKLVNKATKLTAVTPNDKLTKQFEK